MNYLSSGMGLGYAYSWASPLFILLMVWSLFWKGVALWHSGRRGQPWWFVILLILNTCGILEIVYLFGVAKIPAKDLLKNKKA